MSTGIITDFDWSSFTLSDLPFELLTEITNYFPPDSSYVVLSLTLTCKNFHEFLYSSSKLYGPCCLSVVFSISPNCTAGRLKRIAKKYLHFVKNIDITEFEISHDILKWFSGCTFLAMNKCTFTGPITLDYLRNIRELVLTGSNVGDDSLVHMKDVHTLDLSYCKNITDEGVKCLKNVIVLNLSYTNVTGSGFEFTKIYELDISGCKIEEGFGKSLKNIHTLIIDSCKGELYDSALTCMENVHKLVLSKLVYVIGTCFANFKKLHELDISFCDDIDDESLKYLSYVHTLNAKMLDSLITDKGVSYLEDVYELSLAYNANITGNSFNFTNIYKIDLSYCINLVNLKYLNDVHTLNISFCDQITDENLRHVKNVYDLTIANNCFINLSGTVFEEFKNLKRIYITSCPNIKDDTLIYFQNVHVLKLLDVGKITDVGLLSLRKVEDININGNSEISGLGLRNCLNSLRKVNFCECSNIIDESLKYLANVHNLNLMGCNKITDTGLIALKEVRYLNIGMNDNISGKGFRNFSHILSLEAYECVNLSDKYLKYLKYCKYFDLSYCNKVSSDGVKYLYDRGAKEVILGD